MVQEGRREVGDAAVFEARTPATERALLGHSPSTSDLTLAIRRRVVTEGREECAVSLLEVMEQEGPGVDHSEDKVELSDHGPKVLRSRLEARPQRDSKL